MSTHGERSGAERAAAKKWLPPLAFYALLHACLYCSLLPLWEGFDEPFHYGYVQHLSTRGRLPVQGQSGISDEIWESIQLAPASHVVVRNIPQATSFSEYFRMSGAERWARRSRLESLPVSLGGVTEHGAGNYEAQQPPLAYLLLAPPDRLWAGAPLLERIFRLRLLCAIAAACGFLFALWKLGERMALPPPYRAAAVFLLLSTQMVYGAVAHVANDWLSAPLVALLLLAADTFLRERRARNAALLAAVLSAGLLAKAYFLVFVPFAVALVFWAARKHLPLFAGLTALAAGPWYARNLVLYHNLTGLMPALASIGTASVAQSFLSIAWPATLAAAARASLWTANNSFTTFSAATLNVLLILLAAALVFFLRAAIRERFAGAQAVVVAGSLVYAAIPVYAIALLARDGQAFANATPWYAVPLLPVVFLLAFSGCARAGRPGCVVAAAILCLGTYLVAATYFAKLIPLYAGFAAQARPRTLADLYLHRRAELFERLSQTAMIGAHGVFALALATTIVAAALCVWIGISVVSRREDPSG